LKGIATNGHLHPVQQGFWDCHGLQCGFCTPGLIMASVHLLDGNASPSPRTDHPRAARQPVPLHRLLAHHRRREPGRVVFGRIGGGSCLRDRSPLLAETAAHIGDVQVRNRGTIGGSLAHADPATDYPAPILALDAEIDLAGPRGCRTVKAVDFFVDLLEAAIAPDEILIEIRVPVTNKTTVYGKTEQKASGFALAGVAAVVGPEGVRVGVTGVAAKAYRATAVEQALAGLQTPTAAAIALAATHAADGIQALGDIHALPEYRAHLAQVNTRRAIERALARG
jgi:CO/xanthine dehydrogenase FAD-binding subunit